MAVLDMLKKQQPPTAVPERGASARSSFTATGETSNIETEKGPFDDESKVPFLTIRTFFMAVLVSFGGLCFGYDTGQISGFLEMDNFLENFADQQDPIGFSNVRAGLIVGMLSIGTLVGALISGPLANNRSLGRKYSLVLWSIVFCVGVAIQIAARKPHWYEVMIGRIIAGLAIGGMSVMVPAYQGESSPRHVRGAIVCCYQLFITVGILIAYSINAGTESIQSTASWRIVMGIGFLFAIALGVGILFFPETPRHDYRNGNIDKATASIAKFHGVSERHRVVKDQLVEMQEKLQIEREGGSHPWYEIFTGPQMLRRILLGMVIQAAQQLSGANFFFYYGTVVFSSVGLPNSFVTQIILGAVNVITTFPGLYFVEKFGRRKCLMAGAAWMFVCFLIFASLGQFSLENDDGSNNKTIGYVMIVFACLFIAAFASTWGPMAWAVCSELYPTRYASPCIALCAATNWLFNFLIAFFTPFITGDINYAYGYVFAGCNILAVFFVYFFLPETSGRSLEEIDTMFLLEVKPWKSSKWTPPKGEDLITADKLRLNSGARDIMKHREGPGGETEQQETARGQNRNDLSRVPSVSGPQDHLGVGARGNSFVGIQ
ncbi:MFS transporter, SP family, sugar:H+ symporter [Exophiala aquamarina CBS 119918]|uniref:MFS transporter, SP family, sugar:H+ symporter n=1 Tax=Exophiala aquamarina CBS 119918 TaxID=1182545 RepID=A0A072P925_9EURO|nr:MFS transporter, SP family, sugar:H+ symporter [Exophiala aquamarina CBS 119918]KEF56351.1 MFS transporter, SP family, sugar:H+ symporter [Exophiala aquamarina CBS 119918]